MNDYFEFVSLRFIMGIQTTIYVITYVHSHKCLSLCVDVAVLMYNNKLNELAYCAQIIGFAINTRIHIYVCDYVCIYV